MEPVADGIFRLGSRSHNFYVIAQDGEATVIDAGCSREWDSLVHGLASIDLSVSAVSALLVTHAHADHLGFGARAEEAGLDIRVHEEERTRALGTYEGRFSAGPFDLPMYRPSTWRVFLPMLRAGVLKHPHLKTVGTFSEGDVLDSPGSLRAIHTPGHTEGHTMFHSEELGVLFTGDGLVTLDLFSGSQGPQRMRPIFDLDSDLASRSLDRIVELDADLLLPGHGDPWSGSPAAAVSLVRAA